ncbi:MAG: glutathione synthase [Zymomonas mobilis subsp. pomaceae]|uniref:Glutathione synthetase n=1 Tax=Zymomonas mobilis subsp. pomaceae (strain ATCC 29192 / DSM 22645 / JCM 10191 / CCUG 17912 / NBRC 13757 / NCIMB 11200 / NRRL B-4491 / Barker I) TaxID=579138 RepID=F8EU81_ZYMMT|nr:glutathione synthase [Zymomonas mobilis]AEI38102.1 glutathione synthetase [Zymomonas mobilis subsp. pomaceae ATCC 29192]MDX5949468.1 glutathione synthase [Zymomonas mobilis subsp. pomaceae]GEB89211.1 glutathione synthetase [Zymomonas mobilis subsp. pomaceae]
MNLRIAIQMDPLETVKIAGDSSFAMMLAAQKRGFKLWHYLASDLSYIEGRVVAKARSVVVKAVQGMHFEAGPEEEIDLGKDVDVVLMRQDPPFDLAYITATHLLERIVKQTLVVNDPAAVRNAPEKLYVLDFAQFMPPTMITRDVKQLRLFHERHHEVVVKPLYGNAGSAVFYIGPDGKNIAALSELFGEVWREPYMVQAFIPDVVKGDKRIVLIDGEVVGAINRVPSAGEIRSNLGVGGTAEPSVLTQREKEICRILGPELAKNGLLFVGIDIIAGYLTEINVTSPTGIVAMDRFNGSDVASLIWDRIEAKLKAKLANKNK